MRKAPQKSAAAKASVKVGAQSANGGELAIRTLKKAGVATAFGLHGAHIDPLFQACRLHQLKIVDTRHEAAAGHAAEGYARTTGQLGVAFLTAGGGFTNGLTSMANAWLDRTPVLFIAGSGPLRDDETNALQAGIDQVAMAAPVTKWAHRVLATAHIPRLIAQAVRIATTAPRGPVLLDIPWDILSGVTETGAVEIPEIALAPVGAVPADTLIEAALDIIAQAERPAIVVGSEASRLQPHAALAALADCTGAPVFADFEGLNLLSRLAKDYRGGLLQGLHGFADAGCAPDALILFGIRFGLNTAHGTGALIPRAAHIVQIDPDGRELGRLQPVTLGITADPGASIEALAKSAARRLWPNRAPWRATVQKRLAARLRKAKASATQGEFMHPLAASAVIAKHVTLDIAVVADGALTYLWLSEVISAANPSVFLTHGYFGSMGVGFGLALGAQAALLGKKRTILVTGDGAVGYSLAEFDTAVRHNIPLIVVVMNNRSWGATLHFQQMAQGANGVIGTRLENGSYAQAAAAFGARHYRVDSEEMLDRALADALALDAPACIEAIVDVAPVPPEERALMGMAPFEDGRTGDD